MGAFNIVSNYFNRPLADVAKEMGYDEEKILVLSGNLEGLMSNYPETYNNIINNRFRSAFDTPISNARDIVASWLMEDYILSLIRSPKYELSLDGMDRGRKILPSTTESKQINFLLKYNNYSIPVELMNGYWVWRKDGEIYLRGSKYDQLKESQSLLLAVSVASKDFAVYDFRYNVPARYIESYWMYGDKPAYVLPFTNKMLIPLTQQNLEQKLFELLQKKN